MAFLISAISIASQLITLLVIVQVILSYFMPPTHPVKQAVDSIIEPMLAPLRRIVPPMGMMDFTPMVLIILVQIVSSLLVGALRSF
jgi:YggT family protein